MDGSADSGLSRTGGNGQGQGKSGTHAVQSIRGQPQVLGQGERSGCDVAGARASVSPARARELRLQAIAKRRRGRASAGADGGGVPAGEERMLAARASGTHAGSHERTEEVQEACGAGVAGSADDVAWKAAGVQRVQAVSSSDGYAKHDDRTEEEREKEKKQQEAQLPMPFLPFHGDGRKLSSSRRRK